MQGANITVTGTLLAPWYPPPPKYAAAAHRRRIGKEVPDPMFTDGYIAKVAAAHESLPCGNFLRLCPLTHVCGRLSSCGRIVFTRGSITPQ